MKKGISLIVLVITIIVMIIIAGAIILSLSSSNVTGKANWATTSSNRANYQAEYATLYAEYMALNYATDDDASEMDTTAFETKILADGFQLIDGEVVYKGAAITGAPTTDIPTWYSPAA